MNPKKLSDSKIPTNLINGDEYYMRLIIKSHNDLVDCVKELRQEIESLKKQNK